MQSGWFRAPARVNLIGEHTDYNDGLVLPTATALYTSVRATARHDRCISVLSHTVGESIRFDLDGLTPSAAPAWSDYIRGVAAELSAGGIELAGADLEIESDIPLGAGLSSSASLELASAYALLGTGTRGVPAAELATLCQRAEQNYTGLNCGIMDQYTIACARPGHALLLDCRSLDVSHVRIPAEFAFLLVDSGVRHRLPEGDYNSRAAECASALDILASRVRGLTSLRDLQYDDLDAHRDVLGNVLFRRCRHVLTENDRVGKAVAALQAESIDGLGDLIRASHVSLRDDYEVSCAEVDRLVEMACAIDGVHGARMIGGGFGGCVLVATREGDAGRIEADLASRYSAVIGREPWIHRVAPAQPAGEFSRA